MLTMPPKLKQKRECKKRKNQIINGLLNNCEKEPQIGENVTIYDCIQAPIDFKICGKEIKQEVREGYNLVDENQLSAYQNIDTIKDGVITSLPLTKEGIINFSVNINEIDMLEGDYYISCDIRLKSGTCKTINSIQALRKLDIAEVDYAGNIQPFNVPVTNSFQRYVRKYTFSNINDDKFNKFLIQATNCENAVFEIKNVQISRENKEYEPYGQSPSTKFKSPVEYVEGNQDIKHSNKNFFDKETLINAVWNSSNNISNRLITYPCKVEKNQKFTITNRKKYSFSCGVSTLNVPSNDAIGTDDSGWQTSDTYTITVSQEGFLFLQIRLPDNSNLTPQIINSDDFQIEKGDTATDYVPHQSEIYQLSNLPPMYSLENKIVYLKDGAEGEGWYVINNFGILDNSKHIFATNKVLQGYYIASNLLSNFKSGGLIYSTHQKVKYNIKYYETDEDWAKQDGNIISQLYLQYKQIYINYYGDNVNDWWISLNAKIYYELEEPTYTKITDEILIDQLNKLRRMLTYEGRNHFIVTAENGQACNLEVTVYKNSIKIMQKEIDNLKELVLNNVANS